MIVCLCHRVSDRDIAAAVKSGVTDFDELQGELRVATSCGCCRDCAREVFDAACQAARPIVVHLPVPRGVPAAVTAGAA